MIEGLSLSINKMASGSSKSGKINLIISSSDWNPRARNTIKRGTGFLTKGRDTKIVGWVIFVSLIPLTTEYRSNEIDIRLTSLLFSDKHWMVA